MAELKIGRMVLGSVATNCYFVYNEGSSDVLLFDPADQGEHIYKALADRGFTVKAILLTHAHFDHIWGCNRLKELSQAPLYALDEERVLCENPRANVSEQAGRACTVAPDTYLKDGETVTVADISCKVIATPGHTMGSCCYYFEEAGFLISGDTLFEESVGRSDLPTGSAGELVRSVREKLFVLPDEVKVYPGHGGTTTIGHEKENNPYC